MRSRNRQNVLPRNNKSADYRFYTYEHNASSGRSMQTISLIFVNVVCYNYNRPDHKSYDCERKSLQSYDN